MAVQKPLMHLRTAGTAAALVLLTSCAGNGDGPAPSTEIAAAGARIADAERAGAVQYAPVELDRARGKLAQADAAADEEEYEAARRLAEQAAVDARLAEVKAQAEVAQESARAAQQGVGSLREQLEETAEP